MALDVNAFRGLVAASVRAWAEDQARRRGLSMQDPRVRDWIESLIRYRLRERLPLAHDRGAIPADTGIAEIGGQPPGVVNFSARGLICIPASDDALYGWHDGDPTGTTASSWDDCTDGYQGGGPLPPYAKVVIPSSAAGAYYTIARGLPGPSIDLGIQYRQINWIGPIPTDEGADATDVDVISWYSAAARYGMIPPQSAWVWYRGQAICALPNVAGLETYLGAAVGTWNDAEYLVAAFLYSGGGDTKNISTAENWPEVHLANGGSAVTGCGIRAMTHSHYPIRFYRRTWNHGVEYSHDDLLDALHPDGWELLGEATPFTPANPSYIRAWSHPRVLGSVYFSPDAHSAAWSLVDEWTDTDPPPTDVANFCGYQTVTINDGFLGSVASVENPYQGQRYTTDELTNTCTGTTTGSYVCDGNSSCENPYSATFSQLSHYSDSVKTQGDESRYDAGDKTLAVDYDRAGNLVQFKLHVDRYRESGNFGTHVQHKVSASAQDYYCIGQTQVVQTRTRNTESGYYIQDVTTGGEDKRIDFVISGAQEVSIRALESTGHNYNDRDQLIDTAHESEFDNCDDRNLVLVECSGTFTVDYRNGSRSNWKAINLHYLDLRHYAAAYTEYSRRGETNHIYQGTYTNTATGQSCIQVDSGTQLHDTVEEIATTAYIVEGQTTTQIAQDIIADNTATGTETTWNPGPQSQHELSNHVNCATIDTPWNNSAAQGAVAYPLESRTGITGFFHVDATKGGDQQWEFGSIRSDDGSGDEHNVITSFAPTVRGYNEDGQWEQFTITGWANHLSGTDLETHLGIDTEPNPRALETGTI